MIDLGIVGCGDVAFRTYLPGMEPLAGRARVVACFDPVRERALRAAAMFAGARAYSSYRDLLGHEGLDAVVNLTPAPFHRETTAAALEAGLHCFSEKPLAATVEQAQELIELARRRERLLLCAPAVMATERFRWLREVIAAGRVGRLTLATAQMANMGPAGWRQYTGDPAVFYGPEVGPLLDTGVYVLHAITGLMGPARRVQAFGGIAIPRRKVLIDRLAGQTIAVGANDHMLLHLDLGENRFAQVLSSFAVPRSKTAALELHGTEGSVVVPGDGGWYDPNGPVDLFLRDDSLLGVEGWLNGVASPNPGPYNHLIAAGVPHFVACLEGTEEPVLTAEHATHVLEIILQAGRSVEEGRAIELETGF